MVHVVGAGPGEAAGIFITVRGAAQAFVNVRGGKLQRSVAVRINVIKGKHIAGVREKLIGGQEGVVIDIAVGKQRQSVVECDAHIGTGRLVIGIKEVVGQRQGTPNIGIQISQKGGQI